jgi:hypothetical protein
LNLGGVIALGMKFDIMSRQFCDQLRKGIQFMLNHPGPYLIHCYAGVDRTGFTVMVLEALMGANLHEITTGYLESFFDKEFLAPCDSPQYKRDSAPVLEILSIINGGKPVTDDNLKETAENYLVAKAGLTSREIELLKERLSGLTANHTNDTNN